MDVVGSEIGQKMRSAIKAKLTELGCYVDDELPDYVMVMVANKRTRSQMEDDLQLFLGDNTELFVNWLHQVLKKLQEVTVAPLKADDKPKKDGKVKEKKEKSKKGDTKKSKKKDKEKARKKLEKKNSKSKKKSKHQEILRPNIPPLLMNMEKPEPSITDVFAGQILKNHGVTLEPFEDTTKLDIKIRTEDIKRPIVPIIDPATIPSQSEIAIESQKNKTIPADREEQLKEIDAIEAKMQGLKQKLVEQLDSMSDDEDFLNIRTEAEELMNDFAEDVFQEISQPPPVTPPILPKPTPTPIQTLVVQPQKPQETITPETLPQIELNLPKRPIRERLGAREVTNMPEKEKVPTHIVESPERLTPEPEFRPSKSAKSRLGSQVEPQRKTSVSDESDKNESKKLTSKVSVSSLPSRTRSCASVVRVRPRPRVAPASSLLLRAVADAHKSLLNIPPKVDPEPQTVKRALVLPMRRCVDPQKIVIQVPGDATSDSRGDSRGDSHGDTISLGDPDSDSEISSKLASDITERDEPLRSITKVITNTEYVPSKIQRDDDNIETINIHNTTVDKSKDTQFIVTMDGYHPNSFLAKKLMTEGLLDDDDTDGPKQKKDRKEEDSIKDKESKNDKESKRDKESRKEKENKIDKEVKKDETKDSVNPDKDKNDSIGAQKRFSDTSEDSATQVIINQEKQKVAEKRKSIEVKKDELKVEDKTPPQKKRRASPIVFDVDKKEKKDSKDEKERKDEKSVRERTTSASSDSHVVLTTPPNPHKYDAIPPLSATAAPTEKPWCRAFPLCRFGATCAFAHPRCKFAAACTRRACPYSHATPPAPAPPPQLASHVVPAANYKSISGAANLCKFYPGCANAACHFYHPKPCRYGRACANKPTCNFYHDAWK